jgi:hypothetical protein
MIEEHPFILHNVTEKDFPEKFEEVLLFNDLGFKQIDVTQPYHFRYFSNYLCYDKNGLKAQTIIVEPEYTCLTYLEDFINYYAHCYTKYRKQCKRIHFFSEKITSTEFKEMVYRGYVEPYKKRWDSYLGCIVAKPLPKGIIGVTYMKKYNGDEERNRHYTAINQYPINLFGTTLRLDTMPYIEQDGIVGSCASTALWMAFQKTFNLFHTKKLSPSEITMLAGYDSDNTGKFFPSKGLEVSQICKAIYDNGLFSELRQSNSVCDLSDLTWIKSFIYAYLKMGIPILLGIEIEQVGYHLITLNGYRLSFSLEIDAPSYISEFVSKFYAHDDQTGPFSRLKFINKNDEFVLQTSWWKENFEWKKAKFPRSKQAIEDINKYFRNDENYFTCKPCCLIVPIDRKIKVTFEDIVDKVEIMKYLFKIFINLDFIWDVYLTKSNDYKEEVKNEVREESRLGNLLFSSLPQYIWVVKAYKTLNSFKERYLLFDFIFDSIEMPYDGKPFITNIYSDSFDELISNVDPQIQCLFKDTIDGSLYKDIIANTTRFEELLFEDEEDYNVINNNDIQKLLSVIIQKLDSVSNIDSSDTVVDSSTKKEDSNVINNNDIQKLLSVIKNLDSASKIDSSDTVVDSSMKKFDEELQGFGDDIANKFHE